MFREEKDISYSGLLSTIVARNDDIAELKTEIADLNKQAADLRAQLPKPYVVQRGDTHYKVVLNYLMTEHGLSKADAAKAAWQTMLVDEILPANEIWLMYRDGVMGSFVTQGSAKVAPMTVHLHGKRKMMAQINNTTPSLVKVSN